MRVLYFDAFSGISGDMTVGALLSLGLPLDHLRAELAKLRVDGYEIAAAPRLVQGITATKFDVRVSGSKSLVSDSRRKHQAPPSRDKRPGTGNRAARDDKERSRAHHHEHDHEHEEHSHRAFRDIRAMIESSRVTDGVKERALAIFTR